MHRQILINKTLKTGKRFQKRAHWEKSSKEAKVRHLRRRRRRRRRRKRKGRLRLTYFKDVEDGLWEMKAKNGD